MHQDQTIADLMTDEYEIIGRQEGGRVGQAGRLTVVLNDRGRPVAASGPAGDLQVREYSASTPVQVVTDDFTMRRLAVEKAVLVVVTTEGGEVAGVIAPDVLAETMLVFSNPRMFDERLKGVPEPTLCSEIRCMNCGHTEAYPLIEPGQTRCPSCGYILRQV